MRRRLRIMTVCNCCLFYFTLMLLFRDVLYRLWLEMKGVCACESKFVGVICGKGKILWGWYAL